MVTTLLLSLALVVGQTNPVSAEVAPEPGPGVAPIPPASDRWLLMESLQGTWPGWLLDSQRLKIYGWTDVSFTASSATESQLPLGLNYRANDFLLQQNWLRFERSVVTSGTTEPTFGFRTDTILPGSDYRFTLARGIFNSQLVANDGGPNPYGVDPVQVYGEAYFPTVASGVDVKVGKIFCQYGIEAIDAPSNELLSHSYTYFYNPFTHTGALTTIRLNDTWSVQAGMMLGCDVFIDPADSPHGMGSVKWAPPNRPDSILFSFIVGSGRFDQVHNFHNPEVFDLVYTHNITSRLHYSFEALYGFTTNVPDIGFANWIGFVNYLTQDFTPRLNGTVRLEIFDDAQGQRTGFAGCYTALTVGAAFKPRRGVQIRQEIRYDHNAESRPFEDRHDLVSAATDIILRW